MLKIFGVLVLCTLAYATIKLEEQFIWKQVDFAWPNADAKNDAIKSGEYIPGHNLPLGLGRWKDKLFVTVPRYVFVKFGFLKVQNTLGP